ncbi:hypothetical protein GCM10007063_09660 [Lentibacillus kapialis]|uniref:DUF1129 family protein n=1 Tax=Lentibacillus kapialis TaxID=340214 RepID=A0A917UVU1_9BACI|nr:DUF1129 family protein [Lentibacillus kapialis]GGJ89086.1 hypothetical protein GCM10007063_09660 [Lentibacillus kapialis]
MNTKMLVEENNQKRKLLNKENLAYYENMLVYIRLSYSKSDIATEEVLAEMLDHLLEAQEDGKTANDVFGDNPKAYAQEIAGALPNRIPRSFLSYFLMGTLFFMGASTIFNSLFNIILYYGFNKGDAEVNVFLGSFTVKTVLFLPIAFLLVYVIIQYLRWSAFKGINKILEFFIFWLYGLLSVALFLLVIYLLPPFGAAVNLPHWEVLIIGILLGLSGWFVLKKTQ